MRTGKIDGEDVDNMFVVARKLGTSVSRINKWQFEQNKEYVRDRNQALHDLEIHQKRIQADLISRIVTLAIWAVGSVFVVTTGMYVFAMIMHYDTKIVESVWSSHVAIICSTCLGILGTIMGMKYTESKASKEK